MNGELKETAGAAIPELAPLQRKLLLGGAAGALLSLVGAFLNLDQFLRSYLLAYMWCLGVTLGCLALGMVHQLSGGAWGVVIRRPIGAAIKPDGIVLQGGKRRFVDGEGGQESDLFGKAGLT